MKKMLAIISIVALTGVSAFATNPETPQADEKKAGCVTVENAVMTSGGDCEGAAKVVKNASLETTAPCEAGVVKNASLETKSPCEAPASSKAVAATAKAEGECSKKAEADTKVAENK